MNVKAVIAATCIALTPIAAEAEEPEAIPAKARSLAERGRAYHDAGDYADAIEAFKAAYVIAPSPALLFNLAQSYRLSGNCDDAALMYRRYLASDPTPEGRALAETHLATVERCLHKLALHIPVEAPGSAAVAAPPSPTAALTVDLPSSSRKAKLEKDIGIGLGIGGVAALTVAAYYAYEAHDAADQVAAAYAHGAKWKDVAPIDARGKSASTTAQIFGIGGGVGLASGIALYVIGKRSEAIPVHVGPTRHGGEVSVRWQF